MRLPLVLLLAAALGAAGAQAEPRTVEQCVAASGTGQEAQKKASLLAAKKEFEACSDPSCPSLVRTDCTRWLDETLHAIPSLVVVVRMDGVDQPRAVVRLDGHLWQSELSGLPMEVDPGEHELEVIAGERTAGQRIVVNVGEKNRLVVLSLFSGEPNTPLGVTTQPPSASPSRPLPAVPLVLTGATVVGVGLFAGLGLGGKARLSALTSSPCAATKTCDPAQVDEVRRLFVAADVSLAVGVVSAAFAAWQWWRWAAGPAQVSIAVLPGGGGAVEVRGHF